MVFPFGDYARAAISVHTARKRPGNPHEFRRREISRRSATLRSAIEDRVLLLAAATQRPVPPGRELVRPFSPSSSDTGSIASPSARYSATILSRSDSPSGEVKISIVPLRVNAVVFPDDLLRRRRQMRDTAAYFLWREEQAAALRENPARATAFRPRPRTLRGPAAGDRARRRRVFRQRARTRSRRRSLLRR